MVGWLFQFLWFTWHGRTLSKAFNFTGLNLKQSAANFSYHPFYCKNTWKWACCQSNSTTMHHHIPDICILLLICHEQAAPDSKTLPNLMKTPFFPKIFRDFSKVCWNHIEFGYGLEFASFSLDVKHAPLLIVVTLHFHQTMTSKTIVFSMMWMSLGHHKLLIL